MDASNFQFFIPIPKIPSKKPTRCNNTIKVECYNPGGGLSRKLSDPSDPLFRHISTSQPDIFGLVEHKSLRVSSIPQIPGYFRYFSAASRTGGSPSGGVIVFVKEPLRHRVSFVRSPCKNTLWILFRTLDQTCWHLGFVYCRIAHSRFALETSRFYQSLSDQVHKFREGGSRVAVFGDFNSRLGSFVGDHTTNSGAGNFLSFLEFHGLSLLNKKYQFGIPTYVKPEANSNSTSVIDFGVTDSPAFVKDFQVLPTVLGTTAHSSHRIIQCLLDAGKSRASPTTTNANHKHPQFHRLNFDNIEKYKAKTVQKLGPLLPRLESLIDNVKNGTQKHAPNFTLDIILKSINSVKSETLGRRKNTGGGGGRKAQTTRNVRRIQAKLDRASSDLINETNVTERTRLLEELQVLEARKREMLKRETEKTYEYFLSELENLDITNRAYAFWSEVNNTLGQKGGNMVGVIKNELGELSDSQDSFLENWACFYENLYAISESSPSEFLVPDGGGPQSLNHPPTLDELTSELKAAAKDKAPGLDGIRIEELSCLVDTPALPVLGKLLELFWLLEKVPKILKKTILVPIVKKADGDIHDPSNYRPIALMSNLLKIYQRILNRRLLSFLENAGFFSDLQFGFRADRSVVDCHLLVREILLSRKFCIGPRGGRNTKKPVFAAFLDIKKAFDKVPRNLLWKKLWEAGVRGRFLRVVMDQFSDTRGLVRIGNMETREFLVFINSLLLDLQNAGVGGVLLGENTRLNSLGYADDLALFSEDPAGLQKLIEICESWSIENGLEFAPSKCKVVVFHPSKCSKKQKSFRFVLNGISLEKVKTFEYLGLTLESSGSICGPGRTYKKHFELQMQKAEKRLGAVRLLGFHKDGLRIKTAIKLYKLLVRPLFEFCAQILPYSDPQLDEMERFQCKALRTLFGISPSVKAETVRLLAGIEPVACRFSILRTNYFHRIRTSQKKTLKAVLLRTVRDRKLARCFAIEFNFKATAEWVNISEHSFVGLIENTLSKFGLSNEFHFRNEQTRSDFSRKLKYYCRKTFFEKDVATFSNSQQGKLFKIICLPDLVISKPYSGCAINPLVFKNSTREHRTTFLQCLTGSHFASEIYCSAFKKERSKSCCPFCSSPTRTLEHYIFKCPHFNKERLELHSNINETSSKASVIDIKSLFGGKSQYLGASELEVRSCERIPGAATMRHMAKFLHSLRITFEKFGKS